MNPRELAQKIQEIAMLKGQFLLRSGKTSDYYFDKYRFESDPKLLTEIAQMLMPMIPKGTEVLGTTVS